MQFWNELEGQLFDGLYPLRRLTRSEGRTAWFETENGDGQRAAISLTESLTDADEVVKRLEAAQRLRNPNLIAIFKVGRARFENTLFVYALMEHTEQNLAEVLRDQPLSKEDVQQVAEALVGALTAIHQQGLLHGRVEPASVLAVGETVKLRSDCLQTPGSTRAGDVAGIGATIFQAFTQRKADKADDGQINRLPAPFAEIVRNSLSSRWSLGQVAAALSPLAAGAPAPAQTPPAPTPTVPAPTKKPVAQNPVPARGASTAQDAPPAIKTEPAPVSSNLLASIEDEDEAEEHAVSKSFRTTAVYIALAVVVLLVAVWLVFRPKTNSAAANSAAARTASSLAAAPSARPPQEPETGAPAAEPTPAQSPGTSSAKPSPARRAPAQSVGPAAAAADADTRAPADRPVWRVIAFTYNREDQAQRKINEISQEHADLQASVLSSPAGGHPHFLVTIGGPMNRSQALALRDKAAALGLPADTYVQNFSR